MVSGQVTLVVPKRRPSLQTLAWLIVREPHRLDAAGQDTFAQLQNAHTDVGQMIALVQQFAALVRQRQVDRLDDWLAAAGASGISAVNGFVASLRSDLAGVRAALALPWSNGPVEGHGNRLQLLKHQSYGRAHFDLLRLRVLAAP